MKMKNKQISIAIETSCDDTSIALFDGLKLIDFASDSSLGEVKKYGGIVPEIAARKHADVIEKVTAKLISENKISFIDVKKVYYTSHPGLPGSLHIGKTFAKAVAFLLDAKLYPINHIHGHIFSFAIDKPEIIIYPFICLVASGGHTSIYLVKAIDKIELLNSSTDDACGEVLDKIGRVLGLEYPGGVTIDKIYDKTKNSMSLIKHHSPEQNFTFSGFKTHITNLVNEYNMKKKKIDKVLISSSSLK
jgi:N6-L-threonylcarbamoyladenine synthase